jgi:serine protease AprX
MLMIKKIHFLVLLFFISVTNINSQEFADTKYWIMFVDKGEFKPADKITKGSKAYDKGIELLSERSINRRLKVLDENNLIDFGDLPLNEKYVKEIENLKIELIAKSRWLNGVSAYLTQAQAKKILDMKIVSCLKIVNKMCKQEIEFINPPFVKSAKTQFDNFDFLNSDIKDVQRYGKSFKQMELVKVPQVHNIDITGRGVLVANFDDGFDWRNHEALKVLNVIDEYDFINKDINTFYEEDQKYPDRRTQGKHGTSTLSTLAGYKPGQIVSPAYGSDFILAKTEYIASETPMEEDFWLEAAEWAEAKGADIITSSLIYKEFDAPFEKNSYKYKDFNGNVAITTIAGDRAAYLGIVVLNAMGNYYQTDPPSLGSAADGDSIISVGAVTIEGKIANFTSNGPTSDGRTKPDVSAPGVTVYASVVKAASGNDSAYEFTSGTSFSTPITAGICALILSAHPNLTPMQVRDALRNTASNSSNPNNVIGWGIVNAWDALLYHGAVWSNRPTEKLTGNELTISTYLASKNIIDPNSVTLHYSFDKGSTYKTIKMNLSESLNDATNSGLFEATINPEFAATVGSNIVYYFTASDSMNGNITYPFYGKKYFMYGE